MTPSPRLALTLLALLLAPLQTALAQAELLLRSPAVYAQPMGLTLDAKGQLLFVADQGHNEIKVLVASNLDLLGEFGRDILSSPGDANVNRHLSGNTQMLVADTGKDRIVVYAVNGTSAKMERTIDVNLKQVHSACQLDETTVFATSRGSDHLVRFDGSGVSQKTKTGVDGNVAFFRPGGLACDVANARVIMADSGNDRLVVLDRDLKFVQAVGGRKLGFNQPAGVSIGDDGLIFVADQNNDRIVVLDEALGLVDTFGDDILTQPAAVVSRAGQVWVADTLAEQVVLFKWQRPNQ